jgi:hypothetical protein
VTTKHCGLSRFCSGVPVPVTQIFCPRIVLRVKTTLTQARSSLLKWNINGGDDAVKSALLGAIWPSWALGGLLAIPLVQIHAARRNSVSPAGTGLNGP